MVGYGARSSSRRDGDDRCEHGTVTEHDPVHHLYGDLASWWPLLSPVGDYEEEARFAAALLASGSPPVTRVLELGSGGGHNGFHLKEEFELTLVDLSPSMLEVSRRLNPECEHVVGDMRSVRLGRTFDAVFVHDAVMYMTTEDDLRAAMETAFVHCRPGGVALFAPDYTTETFEPLTDHGGSDDPSGRGLRYLEWAWDPDPSDTWLRSDFVCVLREADGDVRVVHDVHHWGLFGRDAWLRLLAAVGFVPEIVPEETTEQRRPRDLFLARRSPSG
jgi:SAM-dependent methyltransferase